MLRFGGDNRTNECDSKTNGVLWSWNPSKECLSPDGSPFFWNPAFKGLKDLDIQSIVDNVNVWLICGWKSGGMKNAQSSKIIPADESKQRISFC